MDITTTADTVTRDEYRVMRQLPGQPRARLWNTRATRAEAVAVIRGELAASADYWRDHSRRMRFGIRHVVVTEVIDGIEWEPEDAVSGFPGAVS